MKQLETGILWSVTTYIPTYNEQIVDGWYRNPLPRFLNRITQDIILEVERPTPFL